MAPRKKKLSKEEIFQRKREAERKRYERIKNDPQKREELREKERLKYLKKKEKGTRKLVENMTSREHREAKKKWRKHCRKYRNKKKVLANITNSFMRENTPDSDASNSCRMSTSEVPELVKTKIDRNKLLRHKIKKKKDEEIKALKKKVYIMAIKIPKRLPHVQKFTWNYTESGHGKGAPDGIGATCKRTADAVVAAGGDVENLDKFVEAIKQRCPKIS